MHFVGCTWKHTHTQSLSLLLSLSLFLKICNTYCFSNATMVAETFLNATLYYIACLGNKCIWKSFVFHKTLMFLRWLLSAHFSGHQTKLVTLEMLLCCAWRNTFKYIYYSEHNWDVSPKDFWFFMKKHFTFQIQFRRSDRVLFQNPSTATSQDFTLLSRVKCIQLIDVYVSSYRTIGCIPKDNQQDATLHSLFISVNYSTCFGWFLHPSSGTKNRIYSIWYLSNCSAHRLSMYLA